MVVIKLQSDISGKQDHCKKSHSTFYQFACDSKSKDSCEFSLGKML